MTRSSPIRFRIFRRNPYRRVDLKAQLAHSVDHNDAIRLLKEGRQNTQRSAYPAPDVEILEFNLDGPVLAVWPYCHNDHYWQVYFDAKIIRKPSAPPVIRCRNSISSFEVIS